MAQVTLTALCKSAVVDRFSNSLSLLEIVEELQLTTNDPTAAAAAAGESVLRVPGVELKFVIVFVRSDDAVPESATARVVIRMPSGQRHIGPETTVELREYRAYRNIGSVTGMPVSGSGLYYFDVEIRDGDAWKFAATYPVKISVTVQALPVDEIH
jgi:hypothetical protein